MFLERKKDRSKNLANSKIRGLKFVSKFRAQRLACIAERIAADGDKYDIVALQEIWVEEDYELLRSVTAPHFRYHKYFYSGILSGPGLLVLSKWPIESASLFRYPLNGRPSAFFRGDWYVGKSAASVVIRPIIHKSASSSLEARPIELLSTHMHAPYGPGDASYTCHRTAQAWELARLARRASQLGHAVVVLGDLNSIPGSLTHRLFQYTAGLRDSWIDIHGEFEGGPEAMGQLSPEDQIVLAGTTCDSQLNTWRATRERHEAKRLDYIFYDPKYASPSACRVAFVEPIQGIGSVSDHFAVEADLVIANVDTEVGFRVNPFASDQSTKQNARTNAAPSQSSQDSLSSNQTHEQQLSNRKSGQAYAPALNGIPGAISKIRTNATSSSRDDLRLLYSDILRLIEEYKPTSIMQARLRNYHFIASVVALIIILITVWWGAADNRAYVGFIFILLTITISVTGLIDGLIGFLFGRNEWRALLEFESEVELESHFLG